MDFLKSLTAKQWLIIFCVIVFLSASYFIFFRKSATNQVNPDLETLMRQGAAQKPVDQALTKKEVNILLQQSTASRSATSTQASDGLTTAEKNALLKLMSVPKK